MRNGITDMGSGVFSILIATLFYTQTGDLSGVSLLYPQLLLGFIFIAGVFLLIQGLIKFRKGGVAEDGEPVTMSRVFLISIFAIAYVAIIPVLGFYAGSVIFLFGASMLLNDAGYGKGKAIMASCLLTVIMCLCVWGGFALLLGVPTPQGLLF